MKGVIHFAHGNGFPSPCYRQLFQALVIDYDLFYIDKVGHNPDYPVTENWHCLIEELIFNIEQRASEPVIAVGHSLGGVLSVMAAVEKPALFKAVIMIDSPLINRFKSKMVRFAKQLGIIDRVTPAYRTRGRRQHWDTKEQLWYYLKTKPLFKRFTDRCLQDYIDYGCVKTERGFTLRFDKQVEYQIYRTIPHILPQYEGRLSIPVALITGEDSDIVDNSDIRYMKKAFGIQCYHSPGTHMLPMEYPEEVATIIKKAINDLIE